MMSHLIIIAEMLMGCYMKLMGLQIYIIDHLCMDCNISLMGLKTLFGRIIRRYFSTQIILLIRARAFCLFFLRRYINTHKLIAQLKVVVDQ